MPIREAGAARHRAAPNIENPGFLRCGPLGPYGAAAVAEVMTILPPAMDERRRVRLRPVCVVMEMCVVLEGGLRTPWVKELDSCVVRRVVKVRKEMMVKKVFGSCVDFLGREDVIVPRSSWRRRGGILSRVPAHGADVMTSGHSLLLEPVAPSPPSPIPIRDFGHVFLLPFGLGRHSGERSLGFEHTVSVVATQG